MKRLIVVVLSCVLALGVLTACGGNSASLPSESSPESAESESPQNTNQTADDVNANQTTNEMKIGVSMNSADEFRSSWLNAFEEQAEAKGYEVVSTNADSSADKQISDIESLIQQDIDVAVVHAYSEDGIVPALDALKEASLPVILVDFQVASDDYVTLVSDDQSQNGVIQGGYVNKWLAEDSSRVANVGYFVGLYSMEGAMPRMTGFFDTCTAANKLAEGEGSWTADGAMSLTEDWLQAYPDMNVFVAMSDEMALGCVQALKAAGKDMDEVLILGIDGSKEGIASVKAGELDCTAARDVNKEAGVALECCEKTFAGETLEKQTYPNAITALTIDNVE